MLAARCVSCHNPQATNAVAAKFDLTPAKAYDTLVAFGKPSLQDQVWEGYRRGFSSEGEGIARKSALLALLDAPSGHYDVSLDAESRERLLTWMDTYAQRLGSFQRRTGAGADRVAASLRGHFDRAPASKQPWRWKGPSRSDDSSLDTGPHTKSDRDQSSRTPLPFSSGKTGAAFLQVHAGGHIARDEHRAVHVHVIQQREELADGADADAALAHAADHHAQAQFAGPGRSSGARG